VTRLEAAHAEYVAALREEKALIDAELARLVDTPTVTTTAPAATGTGSNQSRISYVKPIVQPPVIAPPHRPFRGAKAKVGTETCAECGRGELKKVPGPGGFLTFHYSPGPCELPCAGASLYKLKAEDTADGIHSRKNCKRCVR